MADVKYFLGWLKEGIEIGAKPGILSQLMSLDLLLAGCAPIPLAHYLKALGVLRLVTEQSDSGATGAWSRNSFLLRSNLDREGLIQFFLRHYRPTPILAPWNGGSGFHKKDNTEAITAIEKSKSERF